MKSKATPVDPHGFSSEIRQIEREIVSFFAQRTQHSSSNEIMATVMAYFYMRRNLTQRDLQHLTGFSAGTISESVSQLVEINFITKDILPGTHKHIYRMHQLPFRSPSYLLKTETVLEKLKRKLEKMKKSLDTQGQDLEYSDRYKKIYAIITQLLAMLSKLPVLMDLIEKELQNYLKRENQENLL